MNWLDHDSTHRLLVEASSSLLNRPGMDVARANYLTAWQLSLDLNQPGGVVEEMKEKRREAALALVELIR